MIINKLDLMFTITFFEKPPFYPSIIISDFNHIFFHKFSGMRIIPQTIFQMMLSLTNFNTNYTFSNNFI